MKRIFYIVLLLALTPTLVNALGLGNLDLNSALNEPFDARIQLLSPTADELDSFKINLADSEAFARAKVDRPFILSKLKFALHRSAGDGPDYIRVYSKDAIREPFLNFLVEVSWSNGRLFREYTVLLDPPLYNPNVRSSEITQVVETEASIEAVTIDDPDHKVVYAEAFEQSASTSTPSPTYTSNVNYISGDYGPTTGADTLWSIASEMRPDTSTSVNQMMLALLRANSDAFLGQNINGLKRGQILRMPDESEINALSNAEALAEVQSQYGVWSGIKDNLSSAVSERPEVSSVSESSIPSDAEMVSEEVADVDPELKLVAADDAGEATEQVSSVDSGSGEQLVLAQESIQVLTQENIELKDQVQESEALLDDLKRLLSLKDDELAALQEQMAAQSAMDIEAEEEMVEVEEELIEEAEEGMAEVEEEFIEEEMAEVEEELIEEAEEEILEVVELEVESGSDGIMGMVNQYLGPLKELLLGNPMIGMAVAGFLVVLIIVIVLLKFRKEPAEVVNIDEMTEEAFPDFDSGDLGDTGAEDSDDSEAVTVLPDSEAETAVAEEPADLEDEKTQFIVEEETPVAEEEQEEEEDPLQEVNTYLAFEQFDQAEEFVRNVINDDPDNPEFHTKLLEVFYTSGNKKSYEEAAKVLHDKVGGEGEHWNMAVAMWQEMSPNRALFEEGGDDEDSTPETSGGGFVDVTADEEAGDSSAGLDFDIGGSEEETPATDDEEILDITASAEGEDLLDVTAAVGLSDDDSSDIGMDEDVLDISGTGGEDLLDLTSGDESSGEDLLDVTAAANLDLDSEEDLLDVTAATSAGADSSTLLELDIDAEEKGELEQESNEIEFDITAESTKEDNVIDFDMTSDEGNDIEIEVSEPAASEADDAGLEIELDIPETEEEPGDEGLEIDLDISETEEEPGDAGLEIDLDISETEDEEPIRLDVESPNEESQDDEISLDIGIEESASDESEVSLDLDMGEDDGAIELDLSIAEDDGAIELDLSIAEDDVPELEVASADDAPEMDFDLSLDDVPELEVASADDAPEMDFDLSLDDASDELTADEADFDLDGTVEIPKSTLSDDDDDDDDDEHTVFVPRAAQPEEQSAEDEIATKLDLAKAYVELGDKDSAKTILDEVIAEGSDEQRQQAEDLLGQV